jgi:hypothetical protein
MPPTHPLIRGAHIPLILLSVLVSPGQALPYGTSPHLPTNIDPDCDPHVGAPSSSMPGVGAALDDPITPPWTDQWAPTAYQIGDGQVQVSFAVSTTSILLTTDGSTFLSASTLTSSYTYTPVPRQITSATVSTTEISSVAATPTPSTSQWSETSTPQTSIPPTTGIPDSLLTSLTTFEVQSVTAPPLVEMPGVSLFSITLRI